MDFAGHPTIGASFVLLEDGIVPAKSERFVLEENIGPVPIRVEHGSRPMIWLTTPPIQEGPVLDGALCADALGLAPEDLLAAAAPQRLSAGNPTVFIAVRDKQTVDRAWLDMGGLKNINGTNPEPVCVFVFAATSEGAYSRMFAPEYGVVEDPATGSSTGPLAAYMIRHNLVSGRAATRFVSEQGTKMETPQHSTRAHSGRTRRGWHRRRRIRDAAGASRDAAGKSGFSLASKPARC